LVADFRNVIYLLCFDPEIVAEAIANCAGVNDGRRYLEKIVQVSIPIPVPEAFDLRRWFENDLGSFLKGLTYQQETALASVIDIEGGAYLRTPRSVVRTLDAVRFYWTGLEGRVHPADLVWLQLTRSGNPDLYHWCERYLVAMAAQDSGRATISEEGKSRDFAELEHCLANEKRDFREVGARLSEFLPGVDWPRRNDDIPIFVAASEKKRTGWIGGQRLASPDHFRLYFAFDQPKNSPKASDLDQFLSELEVSPDAAEAMLLDWGSQFLSSGATRAEAFLDRLEAAAERLNAEQATALIKVLSDVADDLAEGELGAFLGPEVWRTCTRLVEKALELSEGKRKESLTEAFKYGRSVGWLTSVLRKETFAHGRHGDQPSKERILSPQELDLISALMIERYRAMSWAEFEAMPDQLNALFGWAQAGDPQGPRNLLAEAIKSDEALLGILESWSGIGGEKPRGSSLSRSNLSLLPYEEVLTRVNNLAASEEAGTASRAKRLLARMEHDQRF
jgi:hypothetical protein